MHCSMHFFGRHLKTAHLQFHQEAALYPISFKSGTPGHGKPLWLNSSMRLDELRPLVITSSPAQAPPLRQWWGQGVGQQLVIVSLSHSRVSPNNLPGNALPISSSSAWEAAAATCFSLQLGQQPQQLASGTLILLNPLPALQNTPWERPGRHGQAGSGRRAGSSRAAGACSLLLLLCWGWMGSLYQIV